MEACNLFDIARNLPKDDRCAKRVLEYVLHQVVEFKKLNQVKNLLFSIILINFEINKTNEHGFIFSCASLQNKIEFGLITVDFATKF